MRAIHAVTMGLLLGSAAAVPPASAQSGAERPVRVVVGLAPGGGTDTIARIMTQKLSEMLKQTFVVDNRPSAGGNVAGEIVAKAAPDAHTLLVVTPTHVVNPSLFRDIRYHAVKDFAPISMMVSSQYVLSVRTAVAATTVKELIALAKASPQRLTYASSGIGSPNHLSGELFKTMTGVDMTHVPYKGAGPATSALISGEVQVMFSSIGGLMPHIKAGRLRALAVTGARRTSVTPDIPTIAESGVPGFEVSGWYGLAATAGSPRAEIQRLNAAVNRALPELKERYFNIGVDINGSTPEEFGAYIKSEYEKWARIVKLSGAKVE